MKLSEKIQEALREQQEINLSDPAVQKRLAAQWGYIPAGAQPAPIEMSITTGALSEMFLSLDGHDKAQPGYEWRKGWNDAIRQAMDYAQPAPSVPEFCPCCGNIMRACMLCPNEDCNAVTATAEQSKYNKQHALARKASGAAAPEAKP